MIHLKCSCAAFTYNVTISSIQKNTYIYTVQGFHGIVLYLIIRFIYLFLSDSHTHINGEWKIMIQIKLKDYYDQSVVCRGVSAPRCGAVTVAERQTPSTDTAPRTRAFKNVHLTRSSTASLEVKKKRWEK